MAIASRQRAADALSGSEVKEEGSRRGAGGAGKGDEVGSLQRGGIGAVNRNVASAAESKRRRPQALLLTDGRTGARGIPGIPSAPVENTH